MSRRPCSDLRLRPPTLADQREVLDAERELHADGFKFALGHQDGMAWPDYLQLLARERVGGGLEPARVPATFLLAEYDGQLVGRVSVRHTLNEWLEREGGHVGFGVRPQHRRRGYASAILAQALVIARSVGVGRVLVTCDTENLGSAAVIRGCGGVLDSQVLSERGVPVSRYWID